MNLPAQMMFGILAAALIGFGGSCKARVSGDKSGEDSIVIYTNLCATAVHARPKILLVHSYHPGYEWCDAVTRGVRMALPQNEVELQVFYLDTKRHPSEEWKTALGEKARSIVDAWQPRVIIAVDDNAQKYFATNWIGHPGVDIVFCGVNNPLECYGYPAINVAGVQERPHVLESYRMYQQINPGASRIAIVTDDSETSAGALPYLKSPPEGLRISACFTPSTFPEWQTAVHSCQTNADAIAVYMYHTVKAEGERVSMAPQEVLRWTVENSRLPLIGFFVFSVDMGALCGYLESGVAQGYKAGQMCDRILRGESAGAIPVVTALEGQSMINLRTASRLGLVIPEPLLNRIDLVIEK